MAQQNTAATDAPQQNDPELAAADLDEAAESLQALMGRDAMREMCRSLDLDGYSGTKAEMAETMLDQALDATVAYLAEEGVEILGDLAALTGRQDSEDEQEDEDDSSSGRQRATVEQMLAQHPDDYHRKNALAYTEKQAEVLGHAMAHPLATDQDVAEALDCSARYVNSVCHRWDASEAGVEAVEDAGYTVPAEFQETLEAQEGEN